MDPNIAFMAKVSHLIEVLRLGGSCELVYQLWAQFTLSAVWVNVDVMWSRDEVLVSISASSVLFTHHVCIQFVACLFNHSEWDVPSDFLSLHQLDKIIRELKRGI